MIEEPPAKPKGFEPSEQQGFLYRSMLGNSIESSRLMVSAQGRSIENISIGPLSTTGSQFTTITETISDSDDGVEKDFGEPCAWGPIRPQACQRFRNPKVVLGFLCLVAIVQVDLILSACESLL